VAAAEWLAQTSVRRARVRSMRMGRGVGLRHGTKASPGASPEG
jgi:hypothetical protein